MVAVGFIVFCPLFLTLVVFVVAAMAKGASQKPGTKRKTISSMETHCTTSGENLDNLESQPPNSQQSKPPKSKSQPKPKSQRSQRITWNALTDGHLCTCVLEYQSHCNNKNLEYNPSSIYCAVYVQPLMAKEFNGGPYQDLFGKMFYDQGELAPRSVEKAQHKSVVQRIQNHVISLRGKFVEERKKHQESSGTSPPTMQYYDLYQQIFPKGSTSGEPYEGGRSCLIADEWQELIAKRKAERITADAGTLLSVPRAPAPGPASTPSAPAPSPSASTPSPTHSPSLLTSYSQGMHFPGTSQDRHDANLMYQEDRFRLDAYYKDEFDYDRAQFSDDDADTVASHLLSKDQVEAQAPSTNITPVKITPLNPLNNVLQISMIPKSQLLVPEVTVPVPESKVKENVVDDEIPSGSGSPLENAPVEKLLNQTKHMSNGQMQKEFEARKTKNLKKETTKSALNKRMMDESTADNELKIRCHADLTDHQAKVQESDRRQIANGEEFNRIFAEVERVKAEVEREKIQLRRDEMEFRREAERADRVLRERELQERQAMRIVMARYLSTGQLPSIEESQISDSMYDNDVLNSTQR